MPDLLAAIERIARRQAARHEGLRDELRAAGGAMPVDVPEMLAASRGATFSGTDITPGQVAEALERVLPAYREAALTSLALVHAGLVDPVEWAMAQVMLAFEHGIAVGLEADE